MTAKPTSWDLLTVPICVAFHVGANYNEVRDTYLGAADESISDQDLFAMRTQQRFIRMQE